MRPEPTGLPRLPPPSLFGVAQDHCPSLAQSRRRAGEKHSFLHLWPLRNTQRNGRSGSACGAWPERPGVMRGWVEYPGERRTPSPGPIQSELAQPKGSIANKRLCGWYYGGERQRFFVLAAATSRTLRRSNDGDDGGPSLSDPRPRLEGSLVHQSVVRLLTLGKLV